MKPRPWYHVSRRILVAFFATVVLDCSLISVKIEHGPTDVVVIESREQPNLVLGAIALYLLGVATDFDLALPLRMLKGVLNNTQQKDDEEE